MAKHKLGPTGRFPEGKLGPDDKGELTIAVSTDVDAKVIRIEFGEFVDWIGMGAEHARGLAQVLIERADELDPQ